MIDLHTHLLPGIDDGAKDLEETMKLTETLYLQNVRTAVCTPHFDPTQISMDKFLLQRENALNLLAEVQLRLIPASETRLHDYLFHYPDLSYLCIENTRYLLLELPFDKKWKVEVFEKIKKLMTYYNIVPIIAHIERYPAVKRNEKNIIKLIDLGSVIQCNTSSLVEKRMRKRLFTYLRKNYIDVLGSDCHNMQNRPPCMEAGLKQIENNIGISCIKKLERNAECIVNGIELRKKKSYIID